MITGIFITVIVNKSDMDKEAITFEFDNRALRVTKYGVLFSRLQYNRFSKRIDKDIALNINNLFYLNQSSNIFEYTNLYEDFTYFHKLNIPENSKTVLICNIRCLKKTKVVLLITHSTEIKVWLNKHLLSVNNSELIITEFIKGNNIITIEFSKATVHDALSLRISSYDMEMNNSISSLLYENHYMDGRSISIIDTRHNLIDVDTYNFFVIPNNTIDIDLEKGFYVIFEDTMEGILIDYYGKFYKNYKNNMSKFRKLESNTLSYIIVSFYYYFKDGRQFKQFKTLVINPYEKIARKVIKRAEEILDKDNTNDIVRINIAGYLNNINCTKFYNFSSIYEEYYYLNKILEQKKNIESLWYREGFNNIYYNSKLDDSIQIMRISIPKRYNMNKLPLIIFLSNDASYFSLGYRDFNYEPVIFADISVRGITTGSYIGELAALEAIDIIKNMFSIDEKRIFLFGYSNGAYSVWSLAENYPDKFAGIFPLGGSPFKENLCNLINMAIINISSKSDTIYKKGYLEPEGILKNNINYKGELIDEMNHSEIGLMLTKGNVINELLQYSVENYPNRIHYRTIRNRHRRAYWIEIHSIEFSYKYAEIEAEILNERLITIRESNTEGFTVFIPPKIDKRNFQIIINGTYKFNFTNCIKNIIIFKKTSDGFYVSDNEPIAISRKGTGIIDIYLNTLKIVIADTGNIVETVANNFARPSTYGYDPVIKVDYPIIQEDCVTKGDLLNNLVLISLNGNNKVFSKIKDHLNIQTNKDGFIYNNEYYESDDYCIIQEIVNPYNTNTTIVSVESNSEKALKNDLFVRKIVLPGYCSGLHPLNNEALIYMNGHYYSVFEWGDKIIGVFNEDVSLSPKHNKQE